MKQKMLLMLASMLCITAFANDFTYTFDGKTLKYSVLDEESKTCAVSGEANNGEYLGDLVIPETAIDGDKKYTVTAIKNYAFSYIGMTSVDIPNSVITIGENAFGNSEMVSATLGNSVAYIGKRAFFNCFINSINIPNSVTYIGSEVFDRNAFPVELKEVHINSIESWMKIKFESHSANPLYHAGKLLLNGEPLTDLTIPEGTDSINDYIFYNCESLVNVTFPSGVKHIGMSAFQGSGVKRFNFNDVRDYLGLSYASSYARLINGTNAQIYVKDKLFQPEELVWPEDLTVIPDFAFFGDKHLKRIILPDNLVSIGKQAFSECLLTEISIPNSVTTIGNEAFSQCRRLASVSIGNDIDSIGDKAFNRCDDLTTVRFTGAPASIGEGAFTGYMKASALISDMYILNANDWCRVETSDPILKKDGSLYINNTKVTNLVLKPESGTVNARCFENAPVEKVRIIATEIKNHAFYKSPLSALCLDVKAIDTKAFYSCKNLKTVYSMSAEPPTAPDNAFFLYKSARLYVPSGCRDKYRNSAYCWRLFDDIVETDFAGIDQMFAANYTNGASGTENIVFENDENLGFDQNAPYEIYNLSGVRIIDGLETLAPGIYILRQGRYIKKIAVK
jgi:hypothetical protein